MRDYRKASGRWLRTGWFLAFALLALPNCSQVPTFCSNQDCSCDPVDSECAVPEFDPGPSPAGDAIMCDIPVPAGQGVSDCATAEEAADTANLSLTEAATALVSNRYSYVVLDFSATATEACGGLPKKIVFQDRFPDGSTLCINCGAQIPAKYATPTKACIAKCKDLINFTSGPVPAEGADAFCEANAHTSTNYYKNFCDPRFAGACTNGGNPDWNFVDPRRTPENVMWTEYDAADLDVFDVNNNSLKRIKPTTGTTNDDFNVGAASLQMIVNGDGWVEFSTDETGADLMSHVLSLRESCDDPLNCPDDDPGIGDIGFAISLNSDGKVYVLESKPGPDPKVLGPFMPPYAAGERFRVRAVDNHDGTATISYSRFHACTPGPACEEDVFATSLPTAVYPLRVDTSFREQNATLTNVTLVRIIPQ
jgi:hypothetical protein